jgi:hypothetical protein
MIVPRRARDVARKSPLLRSAVVAARHRGLRVEDVFIASFPRSGNTLLRFLLSDIATNVDPDFELVDRVIPNVGSHRAAPAFMGSGRLIKTHEPHRRQYRRGVYLVRDVRDVLVSWYRVMQYNPDDLGSFDKSVRSFVTRKATPYGSWAGHVRSWLDGRRKGLPILVYRFEDLRANPAGALHEITHFIGLPASQGQIDRAIARNTPERMRELEEASTDYLTRTHGHRSRGVRSGAVGGWRDLLGANHLSLLEPALGLNAELGYGDHEALRFDSERRSH